MMRYKEQLIICGDLNGHIGTHRGNLERRLENIVLENKTKMEEEL